MDTVWERVPGGYRPVYRDSGPLPEIALANPGMVWEFEPYQLQEVGPEESAALEVLLS